MALTPSSEFFDHGPLTESPPSSSFTESWRDPSTPKPISGLKAFRPRKSHTKSRKGCQSCKRRRIKCDESKPGCDQCHRYDIVCHYPSPVEPKKSKTVTLVAASHDLGHPWLSGKVSSMSNSLIAEDIAQLIYPHRTVYCTANKSLVYTLQHFEAVAYSTHGSPAHQQVLRKHALIQSQNTPFLLHAIFAFSARHLQVLQPSDPKHQLEAEYHSKRSFYHYKERPVARTNPAELDAWVTGYLLLCALSYHLEQQTHDSYLNEHNITAPSSFLWSAHPGFERLDFVAFLGNLLRYSRQNCYTTDSVWLPILSEMDDEDNSFADSRTGAVDLPPLFVSLCNITSTSNAANNPYHTALRLLTPMVRIEGNVENFSKLISFPCRMRPEFVKLYRAKDPAAQLIMAYWFGQMCGVETWWCKARSVAECWSICNYLDGWPDERIRLLLRIPMQKCGYIGIDMDAIQTCVFGM